MAPTLQPYARLEQLTEPTLLVKYPRSPGYRPQLQDNPLGAWYWRCNIKGTASGLLAGKTVAIKDNVCMAGIPMMNGTSVLEGYVPDVDATLVTRILDAGGTLLGKAVCESLCFSGGSHTSDTGPVRNPHDPTRTTGGSSSGSAALVAAGAVDMASGGEQGGSIRMPSSWGGIYGLNPPTAWYRSAPSGWVRNECRAGGIQRPPEPEPRRARRGHGCHTVPCGRSSVPGALRAAPLSPVADGSRSLRCRTRLYAGWQGAWPVSISEITT